MRTTGLVLTLALAAASWGQQTTPARVRIEGRAASFANTPTPADMYCGGFITTDHISSGRYIAAGWNSPDQTRFAAPIDYVYIRGRDIKEGDRFEIVRHVKNPNRYEAYPGEHSAVHNAGEPYFEMGYVKVINVQKHTAVAVPELACGDFVVGDVAVPFVERPAPVFHVVTLDRFAPPNGKPVGRIIMANEFDTFLGTKSTAYLNIGENKGLKVGDYLRATRTYSYTYHDMEAGLSLKASYNEDTQKDPQKLPRGDLSTLPRRTLGDMMVLQVHKKSATVLILTALEDIHVGDGVELMDVAAAPELKPLQPTSEVEPGIAISPVAVAAPPQIACSGSPATVHPGESSTITCQTFSPDNRPISVTFTTNGGKLATSHNQATLDTTDAGAGPIAVRAIAYDDRQLSASAVTTINVEGPTPVAPTPQKLLPLDFKPNSAYVDNRSKAILDDVALKLQQDPTSSVQLTGAATPPEPAKLAGQRAENAKTYLTKSKGIDPQRVQVQTSTTPGRGVDIVTVPAGASAPK